MFKKNFFYLTLFLFIFIFYRITKILVLKNFNLNDYFVVELTPFLSLNLIWNSGIAFGLFSLDQGIYYNFLTGIILLITIIILWMFTRSEGTEKIAFLMILSGSFGNIFDRVYYRSVPDFIDFHVGNFHWFIFNVADIFITLGVILLIYFELIVKKKK